MALIRLPEQQPAQCVLCGSTRKLEMNHSGGRHHLPSVMMPYCKKHHDEFHVAVRQAGIDLRYTDNPLLRFVRAMKMLLVAAWGLLEQLEHDIQSKGDVKQ
jgi:hypothetical protein